MASIPAYALVSLVDKGQNDWKLGIYGFAETDAIMDTTRSLPETAGNRPIARPSTFSGDNGRTQFSIRNSRLGFTASAPRAGDWNFKGTVEMDFLGVDNASTEAGLYNNPSLRARHFYLQAESDGWQLIAGQTWTLFGWQPYYFLMTDSVAPVSGVLYERTAQFTALKTFDLGEPGKLTAGLSLVRPVERDSRLPGLDAGLRWVWAGRKAGYTGLTSGDVKAQPMSIGLSGRLNEFAYQGNASDTSATTHLLGSAAALDVMLPVLGGAGDETGNTLALSGEASIGRGYGEGFPGWSGNLSAINSIDAGLLGIDSNGAPALVSLQSWNVQAQYHLPADLKTFVTAGYGQLGSANVDTLKTISGIAYKRSSTAFLNLAHGLTQQVRLALEYDLFRTAYADDLVAHDHRVQASAFFFF
jgi:hypothetical protein